MASRVIDNQRATPVYVTANATVSIRNDSGVTIVFNEDPNELNATPVGTQPRGLPVATGTLQQIAVSGTGRTWARSMSAAGPSIIDVD